MAEKTQTRRSYDHRFRHLIQASGDIQLAIKEGVRRSTARDWIRSPRRTVVTCDLLTEMPEEALRKKIVLLRRRNERLLAMLRLVIVLLKVFGVSLARRRVADGSKKKRLLRAIGRSSSVLTLGVALRILKLSSARYHSWKREETCALDDVPSCPRSAPQQLTSAEIRSVKEMVTSQDYRHVPTGTLAVLAQRLGKVFASPSTWYRLVRLYRWRRPRWRVLKHQWLYLNSLDSLETVRRLVKFYVKQHNFHLPHSAFRGQTPDEMYFGRGDQVPAKLETAKRAARQARLEENRAVMCPACE